MLTLNLIFAGICITFIAAVFLALYFNQKRRKQNLADYNAEAERQRQLKEEYAVGDYVLFGQNEMSKRPGVIVEVWSTGNIYEVVDSKDRFTIGKQHIFGKLPDRHKEITPQFDVTVKGQALNNKTVVKRDNKYKGQNHIYVEKKCEMKERVEANKAKAADQSASSEDNTWPESVDIVASTAATIADMIYDEPIIESAPQTDSDSYTSDSFGFGGGDFGGGGSEGSYSDSSDSSTTSFGE